MPAGVQGLAAAAWLKVVLAFYRQKRVIAPGHYSFFTINIIVATANLLHDNGVFNF
jgi:hypothetical protein